MRRSVRRRLADFTLHGLYSGPWAVQCNLHIATAFRLVFGTELTFLVLCAVLYMALFEQAWSIPAYAVVNLSRLARKLLSTFGAETARDF